MCVCVHAYTVAFPQNRVFQHCHKHGFMTALMTSSEVSSHNIQLSDPIGSFFSTAAFIKDRVDEVIIDFNIVTSKQLATICTSAYISMYVGTYHSYTYIHYIAIRTYIHMYVHGMNIQCVCM